MIACQEPTKLTPWQMACPECGATCDTEWVDVEVGFVQQDPFHCEKCGWVEGGCRSPVCLGGKCVSWGVCLGRANDNPPADEPSDNDPFCGSDEDPFGDDDA
jgi:hypothetical protein